MSDSQTQRGEVITRENYDRMIAAQRRSAHRGGYDRAIADVLAAAVYVAESALRESPADADSRAVLYRFVARLEAETRRLATGDGFVGDGEGI